MSDVREPSGEVALELDGQHFVLRPSYAAILACETKTGRSLRELAEAAYESRLTIADAATIATEMIQAWGRSNADTPLASTARQVAHARVAELIFETGMLTVVPRIAIVLMNALMGGVTSSGEAKSPRTTTA